MHHEIFELLKTVLRARKISYAELSRRMDISEPTIKRVFATRDCKLSRIVEICNVLEVTIDDLFALAQRTEVRPITLSTKLEAQLAADPSLFYFFILLRDGVSENEMANQFKLSVSELFMIGQRLERLDLVEVQTNGRIKIKLDQPIAFRRDGPLNQMLKSLNLNFVERVFLAPDNEEAGFITQSRRVSANTARHVMRELQKLNRELSEMARQDQLTLPDNQLESSKLVIAWSAVEFSELVEILDKK